MRKPIIGISGGIMIDEGGKTPGYERAVINDDYIQSVVLSGGVPLMLPIVYDETLVRRQVEVIDALILSGGIDVNPILYGEEPRERLGTISPKRDKFDMTLIKVALELNKPILGICRGHQILNVANGGSLYQDLSYIEGCYIKHSQGSAPTIATHTVDITPGTKLYHIIGDKVITNSFHHLAVKEVAPGFRIVALAKDGVVEAIEKEGNGFVLGIQWHPERNASEDPMMLKIFEALVNEAKKV